MEAVASETVGTVELTWAQALLELAEEAGALDSIAAEAAELAALLAAQDDLRSLLESRILSTEERAAAIERIFKGRLSDLLYRFLEVVNRKDRLESLSGILAALAQLIQEKHGEVEVQAYVAAPLSDADAAGVASRVGAALGRQARLTQYVDARLLGGLKLRVADQLYDGSVVTQLRLIRERMIASGRIKARESGTMA